MEQDGFYVGIRHPLDVRRNVLECSREMIHMLQAYERLCEIRKKKVMRVEQLKTVGKELQLLISKLRKELPKTHLRAATIKEPVKETKKSLSELEKLESQLKMVEKQISGMN